jgi:flagellar transcriptional activator FlhC
MKKVKTVLGEARQIGLASELIKLGARLQVLESETTLSRERLLKLYKEIQNKSPPK